MNIEEQKLVSIIVITYNSSAFVLETLESVKAQTWTNLELIISDDGSTDGTVSLCEQWIKENSSRFVRTKLITVDNNTGIPANCNRGVKASNGEWIKLLAGDDLLTINSVESYMQNVNEDFDVIIGQFRGFHMEKNQRILSNQLTPSESSAFFFYRDASFQHKYLLLYRPGFAAGAYIRRNVFDRVCYYDERFHLMEDLPFWLNVTKAGICIRLIKEVVALYRIHDSVSIVSDSRFINIPFHNCTQLFTKEVLNKEIPWYHLAYWETYYVDKVKFWVILQLFHNKRNRWNQYVVKAFNALRLAPYSKSLRNAYYRYIS